MDVNFNYINNNIEHKIAPISYKEYEICTPLDICGLNITIYYI